MTVQFQKLNIAPTFEDLFRSTPITLSSDWYGRSLPSPIDIFLGGNHQSILFGARGGGDPWCAPAQPGDFIEGLWERDVVELFLSETGSPRYQEFNVSPSGAWWTMAFSGYRTRMGTNSMPSVRCHADAFGSGWRAAMAIPLSQLTIGWSSESGALNVTAILGNPQRFVTALDLGGGEPDFHRAERFLPARLMGE